MENTIIPMNNLDFLTIYRIEHPEDKDGMWYNRFGKPKFRIEELCPHGIAKTLPMPLRLSLHRKDGHVWQSAGIDRDVMNYFFHPLDAVNLYNNGFKLFEFDTTMYQVLETGEVLFCRKGIIRQSEIPLEAVWDIPSVMGAQLVGTIVT